MSEAVRELRIARLRQECQGLEAQLAQERPKVEARLEEARKQFEEEREQVSQQVNATKRKRTRQVLWASIAALLVLMLFCTVVSGLSDLEVRSSIVCTGPLFLLSGGWLYMSVKRYRDLGGAVNDLQAQVSGSDIGIVTRLLDSEREIKAPIEELEEGIAVRSKEIDELVQGGRR
jgi:hypothetical protein